MPHYDYICSECQEQCEVFQKITEPALTTCPKCQKETLRRKPAGGIALAFSGDGFYSTMYGEKKPVQEDSGGCCPCSKNNTACDSSNKDSSNKTP